MKRSICAIIIIISILSIAHKAIGQSRSCNFLENLTFTKGVDTIIIKVKYTGLFKSSDYSVLKGLEKEKRLNYNEFGIDTAEEDESSSISFIPDKCSKTYDGTLSRKIFDTTFNKSANLSLKTLIPGANIYLTCIVFEKVADYVTTPFFVIIDVRKKDL